MIGAARIFGGELHLSIATELLARVLHPLHRIGECRLTRGAQLVGEVNVGGGDEEMQVRSIRDLDRINGALWIAILAAGKRGDADPLRGEGDLSYRLEVAFRCGGEARLNDVNLQLGELSRNLQLLGNGEAGARRLLTIAQGGVKDTNGAGGDARAWCPVHLPAPFSAAPCAPSMSTSTGFKKVIWWRSALPTFSIG